MNGYTIFIAQPLLRFCDDFIIINQTSMFDFKQSKNNIATVMKILGHKDPAITLMYIGVNEEDVDNTIRKLKYW